MTAGPTPGPDARLLSVAEVAEWSGLGHQAVRRAIKRGELRALKLCGRIKVSGADVLAWHEAARLPVEPGRLTPGARVHPASNGLRRLLDSDSEGA